MNKTLAKILAASMAVLLLVGCNDTKKPAENKDTNTVDNTTNVEDNGLEKYTAKYTDEANEIIKGFADGDALGFIYENLGKDLSSYKLKDINGKEVTIANGEKTVIELIRHDCAACIASGETIKGTEKKFDGKGYRFIQIFINGEKDDIESYYKAAGISHFNTIIPYSEDVEKMLTDLNLNYVPAFLFVDENKKVSLGMVGYTFSEADFKELADDYAFPKKKLYEMTK